MIGVGITVAWSPDELARAAALAGRAPMTFGTGDEAVRRILRAAGLECLVDPADPALDAAVARACDGWRPSFDPRVSASATRRASGTTRSRGPAVLMPLVSAYW